MSERVEFEMKWNGDSIYHLLVQTATETKASVFAAFTTTATVFCKKGVEDIDRQTGIVVWLS